MSKALERPEYLINKQKLRQEKNRSRDLYKKIMQIFKGKKEEDLISLEVYLKNLINQAAKFSHKEEISPNDFFSIVKNSLESKHGSTKYSNKQAVPNFQKWKALVEEQIKDLNYMAANYREWDYGGMWAPSGSRWYNFDPYTYVECGFDGSMSYRVTEKITWELFSGFVLCGAGRE